MGAIQKHLELWVICADNRSGMFSMELKELLPQVISSGEVWVTILALVGFMYLIGFVSRTHHRPRVSKSKPKKSKKEKEKPAAEPTEDESEEFTVEE